MTAPSESQSNRLTRFSLKLLCFFSIQVPLVAIVWTFGRPAVTNHYLGAFQDKLHRLRETPGERLIVIGGSNIAFGLNSDLLEATCSRPVVNLGLYAPLGMRHQMEMVRRHARPGDCVVISPEYELFQHRLEPFDDQSLRDLFEHAPDARAYFYAETAPSVLEFADNSAFQEASRWIHRAYETLRRSRKKRTYTRTSFNQSGDVVAHHGQPAKPFDDSVPLELNRPETLNESIQLINGFAEDCRQKGVRVYVTFPPNPLSRQDALADVKQRLQKRYSDCLRVPVLGSPSSFVYQREQFYDTFYHLGKSAANDRSVKLALLLQDAGERIQIASLPEARH